MRRSQDRRVVGENPRACLRDLVASLAQPAAGQVSTAERELASFWVYSEGVRSAESDETLAKYRAVGVGVCKRRAGRRGVTECSFAQDCVVCYDQLCSWGVPRRGFVGLYSHVPRLDIATTSRCKVSGVPVHAECLHGGGGKAELHNFLGEHYLVSKRICGVCVLCHHSLNIHLGPCIQKGGFFGENNPEDVNQMLTSSYCVGCKLFLHDECHASWHIQGAGRAWPVSERVVRWDFASRCALLSPSSHEETGLPAIACQDTDWYWGHGASSPASVDDSLVAFDEECKRRGAVHSFVRMKGSPGQCTLCARTMVEHGLSMEHFALANPPPANPPLANPLLIDVWTYSKCADCDVPLHARCAVEYHTQLYPQSPRVLEYIADYHHAEPLPPGVGAAGAAGSVGAGVDQPQCALCAATLEGMFPWSNTTGLLDVGARVVCPGCEGMALCHACFRDQHNPAPGTNACSSRVLSFFESHGALPAVAPQGRAARGSAACRLCEDTLERLHATAPPESQPLLTKRRAAADHALYALADACAVCGVVLCSECTLVWHHRSAPGKGCAPTQATSARMQSWVQRQLALFRCGAGEGAAGGEDDVALGGAGCGASETRGDDSDDSDDSSPSCGSPSLGSPLSCDDKYDKGVV